MNAEAIRRLPLFAGLPESEINGTFDSLTSEDCPAGAILFSEGSRADHFFILLDGEVEIVKSLGTSDERLVAISGPDALLGEMSMFSHDGSHTASVRARTPLHLLRMTFQQFETLLKRNPNLSVDLLRLYGRRLEQSENVTISDLREKNRQLTLAYQELKAAQAAMIEKEKLEHELQLASKIQQSILPEMLPEQPGLDFGAMMIPARLVGGDFYDFIPLDEHRLGVVVGDVCDKGMPAALFMALTYSSMRSEAMRHNTPGETLRAVNQQLLQVNRSDMFVTLLYGILDCRSCTFTYARAGHPAPVLMDGNCEGVSVPYGVGQPIGLFDEPILDEERISVPAGGSLLVFSDGLSETLEAIDPQPTVPQMCEKIQAKDGLTTQQLCERLFQAVAGSAEESLIQDDFTLVWLRNLREE